MISKAYVDDIKHLSVWKINTHKTNLTISIVKTQMQNSADWLSRSHPWKSHEKKLIIEPGDQKLSLDSVVSTTALFFTICHY